MSRSSLIERRNRLRDALLYENSETNRSIMKQEIESIEQQLAQTKEKPDCFKCEFKGVIPGDAHIMCKNLSAIVEGNPRGIAGGWFIWPFNFDPTWLVSCNGFKEKQ